MKLLTNEKHMKMQKKIIFVKKSLKINMLKKKKCKVRDHCHYTGEYRGAAYRICNLKYSEPKESFIVFHNTSNYGYHLLLKS